MGFLFKQEAKKKFEKSPHIRVDRFLNFICLTREVGDVQALTGRRDPVHG